MLAGGFLRRLCRLTAYLLLTLPLMAVQGLLLALKSPLASRLPVIYHALCCRIFGLRLEIHGARSAIRPTLFVVNHASYLDIAVLSAVIEGSFIAKTEVAGWPLFGWLAKLQRTVFVDRRSGSVSRQRDAIRRRLAAGDNLILFPEGTSNDGGRVLPFKSALLSAAEHGPHERPVVVQPVSVAYVRLNGLPIGRFYRPFIAWYGDMELGPHLWTMLGLGKVTVVVIFHAPVTLGAFGSRKALTDHCWRVVSAGVAAALGGRLPVPTAAANDPAGSPLMAAGIE